MGQGKPTEHFGWKLFAVLVLPAMLALGGYQWWSAHDRAAKAEASRISSAELEEELHRIRIGRPEQFLTCPACKERHREGATICPHCQSKIGK